MKSSKKKALTCPQCSGVLNQVKVSKHYTHNPIILDQCNNCGGIWFDKMELFAIKHGEAKRIDNFDLKKLKKFVPIESKKMICPRDKTSLYLLKDKYFPSELKIETCKKCRGFWLNRGEFLSYQDKRKKNKIKTYPKSGDEKFSKEMKAMISKYREGGNLKFAGNVGRLLSTPVDYNGRPVLNNNSKEEQLAGMVGQTAVYILSILLRVLAR